MKQIFWIAGIILSLILIFVLTVHGLNERKVFIGKSSVREVIKEPSPVSEKLVDNSFTIGFTGDIMLARNVENLMQVHGGGYPYQGQVFASSSLDYLVGNFEASVPKVHQKTPSGAFQFSVEAKYLSFLTEANFTHVSLANNHALDHGHDGYKNTKLALADEGLASFGHPTQVATSSVTYLTQGSTTVAIIGLHTLFTAINDKDLQRVLTVAKARSDWQIAYVHWGNEYVETPQAQDKLLAEKLVKYGIDLIIGHHPHVIQTIDQIDGVPVFYSLGNYIFDQYFSRSVQEGLALVVHFDEGKMHQIDLLPVTSRYSRSQPHLMNQEERKSSLNYVSSISSEAMREGISLGRINLSD